MQQLCHTVKAKDKAKGESAESGGRQEVNEKQKEPTLPEGFGSQRHLCFLGNLSLGSRQRPRQNHSEYRNHSETPRSPPNSLSYMCSPGRATAILPSRHAPLQSLQYGSDVGGWSSGKSSFFPPKHKSSVRCMRRATPMPFVATRRHRAMIRQWRKDPLARPRPYFPCRRSSSFFFGGGRERGARIDDRYLLMCLYRWGMVNSGPRTL